MCVAGACAVAILPASAQSAPASTAGLSAAYRINPGDELEIYVWGEERLQRTVRVLPDGTLAFPLVGQVKAQGMLPQDLEKTISERLRDQYRGQVPQVTVSVRSPSGMQFSVMGKVRSPGAFTPGRYTTILEALSLAGGPAEFANLDSVMVIRKQGDQLTTIRFRLSSLFKSGTGDANAARTIIQPGDTIIVP
ncbi:MAG: polysaccharide biosynthesis/export family protein [Novosphingobium sp.]